MVDSKNDKYVTGLKLMLTILVYSGVDGVKESALNQIIRVDGLPSLDNMLSALSSYAVIWQDFGRVGLTQEELEEFENGKKYTL